MGHGRAVEVNAQDQLPSDAASGHPKTANATRAADLGKCVVFLYVKASADAPGHSRCRQAKTPRLSGLDEVGRVCPC